jgi:hypothetical protein
MSGLIRLSCRCGALRQRRNEHLVVLLMII